MIERILFAVLGGFAVYCFMTFSNKFVGGLFVIVILTGAMILDYFTKERIHNAGGDEDE